MEMGLNVGVQVIIMMLLMALGFVLVKADKINEIGVKQMTDILLIFVTPCVIINSYQMDFELELLKGLVMAMVFTLIIHIAGVVICKFVFPKEETLHYRINRFASIYSNCGFMAIPLISAVLGSEGVFYGSGYLAIFNILYWTLGVYCYTEDRKALSLKKAIINPGVIGVTIGILLFVCRIKLPYTIGESVALVAGLNTPLAMIVLGTYLVKLDIKKSLKNKDMYLVHLMRLAVLPVLALFAAKLMGLGDVISQSLMISIACPTAAVTTLFATKFGLDAQYSSEIVVTSTVLSVITIPLLMIVASIII